MTRLRVIYRRTPSLATQLQRLQAARERLRARLLAPVREAALWDELTTEAVYHTNRLEGNRLTFEEARAVIDAQRRASRELPE